MGPGADCVGAAATREDRCQIVNLSMKALLETGVHFGHRTHKWHPQMQPYIFTERNGIHIIDLQQTLRQIEECCNLVRDVVSDGGTILFIGTKRQAQDVIQNEAERCGMPFVVNRWLGGMLTNWRTIRERISELERLESDRDNAGWEVLKKKERLSLQRKADKLNSRLGGIRLMHDLPQLLCVVDVQRENTALREANILDIPVLAMVDTNCDPSDVDYLIASNDDAIRAIKLIIGSLCDAVLEGRALRKDEEIPDDSSLTVDYDSETESASDEELLGAATLAKLSSGELDFGDQPEPPPESARAADIEGQTVEVEDADPTGAESDALPSNVEEETAVEVENATPDDNESDSTLGSDVPKSATEI